MVKEPKEPSTKEPKEPKEQQKNNLNNVICESLHNKLGFPSHYVYTKAINVYDNRWRINVYSKILSDTPSLINRVFIISSYFLQVDNKGKIINEISKSW